MVAAVIFLLPQELKRFSSSLIAAVFSLSNVWFLAHSSYFAPVGEVRPLLHTWSLGVEEQFYILFPIMLAAAFKYAPSRTGALVWCVFAVSLILSVTLIGELSEEHILSDPHPSLGTVGRQRHRSRTCSGGDVPVAARTRRYRRSDWDRGSDRRFQFTHAVSRLRRVASLFRRRAHHMGR